MWEDMFSFVGKNVSLNLDDIMMTHGDLYKLFESQLGNSLGKQKSQSYRNRASAQFKRHPDASTPMDLPHLELAAKMMAAKSQSTHPGYKVILQVLNEEMDELRSSADSHAAQEELLQMKEELKKLQAENEQLHQEFKDARATNVRLRQLLNQAQQENEQLLQELEQLEQLLRQLEQQSLSEQLKKLTERAQEMEKELEARSEGIAATLSGDTHTLNIQATTVHVNEIHHNDKNNTQIHS